MSHVDNGEESIALATQRLLNGIHKLYQKAAKRREVSIRAKQRATQLVRHIEHILVQLSQKRRSLQALIEWSQMEWKRLESHLAIPAYTQPILGHAMQSLVRCQDGLVLLTSGECRHPVDIKESKKTKFPSRLTTMQERADGYTMLYSGSAYSGFGWDEYADEQVGIQKRLTQTLKEYHKCPWEYFEDHDYTQPLDTFLDQHEQLMKTLQQNLQSLKAQMTRDITKRLGSQPTQFSTEDKMEKLEVTWQAHKHREDSLQKITVARRADNFQIVGISVLPNHLATSDDWKREMKSTAIVPHGGDRDKLSSSVLSQEPHADSGLRKKRRRLVILDSDSEEEKENCSKVQNGINQEYPVAYSKSNAEKPKSMGLTVRVEKASARENEDSLRTIKTQMGVDVKVLETAREKVEHEEAGKGTIENDAPHLQEQDAEQKKRNVEEKVLRLSKVLARAEQRGDMDRDENEIWDARECLRQAYMELGNRALWTNTKNTTESDKRNLTEALECFQHAQSLVKKQQESHLNSVEKTNDQTQESRAIQRNLIFLLGQATVNIGIALLEQCTSQSGRKFKRNKKSTLAVLELQRVRQLCDDLRRQASRDRSRCRPDSQAYIQSLEDITEADKLESLACRWMGIAHWHSQSEESIDHAEKAFVDAWSFHLPRVADLMALPLDSLFEQQLELLSETIFATTTLVDLGLTCLDDLKHNRINKEACGKIYLRLVVQALRKQIEIVENLENLKTSAGRNPARSRMVLRIQSDNEMPSPRGASRHLDEIQNWWAALLKKPNHLGWEKVPRIFPRSDVGATPKAPKSTTLPYVVLGPTSIQNRNKRNGLNADGDSTTPATSWLDDHTTPSLGIDSSDLAEQALPKRPTKFRQWGDQLLPRDIFRCVMDTQPGKDFCVRMHDSDETDFQHPSIAPSKPPL